MAYDGGAVAAVNVPLSVADSRFLGNIAVSEGGAILFVGPAPASSVVNSYFEGNTANLQEEWEAELQGARLDPFEIWRIVHEEATLSTYGGGAVFVQDVESFTISACDFRENRARQGGAIVVNGQATATELRVAGCLFQANDANATGGAVHVNVGGTLTLEQNDFHDNSATAGGAIFSVGGSKISTSLQRNEQLYFQNNSAVRGGAINCYSCGKHF